MFPLLPRGVLVGGLAIPIGLVATVIVTASPARPAPSAAAKRSDADLARAIDAYARPLVGAGHLSGELLLTRRGRVVLERFYGKASIELDQPVTATTRFNVASITKPMTAKIAMDLIEQKKLAEHDPIARWIPDFPRGDSIRIEHLLRHRSGIPHELVPDSLATQPMTAAQMVEIAKRLPLDFAPGSRSSYSSGGYTVLARILEIVSGQDYETLLEEHVFRPSGMTRSSHVDARVILPGRAASCAPGPRGTENAPFRTCRVWSARVRCGPPRAISIRMVQAVVSGRLGEGMRQSFVRGGRLEFSGRTGGFKAFAVWDSASGLDIVMVSNLATGAPDLLRAAVPRLAAGDTVAPPTLPALDPKPFNAADWRGYEGVFVLGNGIRLDTRLRNGALYANDWVLLPTTEGDLFSPRDYGRIRGVPGADGRIERLDWTQNGEVYPAPRAAK